MQTVELELLEKFKLLDKEAQLRVQHLIDQEVLHQHNPFDFATWSQEIEAIRAQIRADHQGVMPTIDVVEMLREIRDGED